MTSHRTSRLGAAIPVLLLLASTTPALITPALIKPALAQDPQQGRRIAETWCSNCHVVSREQPRGASTGAPPFTAIAAQKGMTPMALRAFLQTPHSRMPDLHLSRAEIADVAAYIESLRPGR